MSKPDEEVKKVVEDMKTVKPGAGYHDEVAEADEAAFVDSVNEAAEAGVADQINNEFNDLKAKNDELIDDLKRLQADFANFRRRTEEERAELINYAKRDVVMQLLPLLDNIDRALAHAPVWATPEQDDPKEAFAAWNEWAKGVAQVAKGATDSLKKLGVERFKSVGQPFDHNLHEAIAHDGEGETVIEELQPGYKIGDKVIRHAIVKVGQLKH